MKERTYTIYLDGKRFMEVISTPAQIDSLVDVLHNVYQRHELSYGEVIVPSQVD